MGTSSTLGSSDTKLNYDGQHANYVSAGVSDNYRVIDKTALIDLFTNVIAPYERLHELIEEVKPSWIDDFPLVNTIVRNTLLHVSKNTDPEDLILTSIYKDSEDQTFATDLVKQELE